MSQVIRKFKAKITNSLKDKSFSEILSGSIWTLGAKIIGVVLGFALNFIIAHDYGPESMGLFSLINSILTIILLLSLLGTDTAILRLIPEHIAKYSMKSSLNVYKNILYSVLLFSGIMSFILFIGADFIANYFFNNNSLVSLLNLAVFFIIFQAIGTFNMAAIRAFKNVKVYVFMQIAFPLIKLIILLLLTSIYFQFNNPIYALLYSYLGLAILSTIGLWFVAKNKTQLKEKDNDIIKFITIKELFNISFPMFLTSIMFVIMAQIDIIMLGSLSSIEDVGVYAISVKLATLVVFVLGSVNTIIAPKFSELYYANKIEELRIIAQKSSKLMFLGSLPIIVINVFFGMFILKLFGDEFIRGYYALLFLSIGYFINSLMGSGGFLLNMSGHQRVFNKIAIFGALINIILNYILIPIYGIYGAAFASMISMIVWNTLVTVYIKKIFGFTIMYLPSWIRR